MCTSQICLVILAYSPLSTHLWTGFECSQLSLTQGYYHSPILDLTEAKLDKINLGNPI